MKKCDYFKDLILTDYIDGQLDKGLAGNLESHLLDCNDCRVFFKEVKQNVVMPFTQNPPQPVPAELWTAIKQNIEKETQSGHPVEGFIEKIKGLLTFPRMVPVFASLAVMFLIGSIAFNSLHFKQVQAKDQGEYLASVVGNIGLLAQADNNDLGTPIESYFL